MAVAPKLEYCFLCKKATYHWHKRHGGTECSDCQSNKQNIEKKAEMDWWNSLTLEQKVNWLFENRFKASHIPDPNPIF